MPINDPNLVLGDVRDGLVVIKVINAPAGQYHWSPASGGDSIFLADQTADAAHSHALGDFAQTWNNLGAWSIDQEIAALPGSYQNTTLDTGGLAVNAIGAAGVTSDLDVAPNTARLVGAAGTEAGGVEFTQAPNARTRAYYMSTSGAGTSADLIIDADGFDFALGSTEDLRLNNDPGTAGQALLSQGPDAPPIWGAAAAAPYRQTTLAAAWTLNGGNREITIPQATHGLAIAGSYLIQTFDATTPAAQVVFTPDSVAVNSTTGDITIAVADGSEVDVAIVVLG